MGERGYGREDRGLINRAGDEVRSWFGDEEAERRRRMDERMRARELERGRDYGPGYEQRWGDDPYRGETWRGGEMWRGGEPWGRAPERGWPGGAGAGRAVGGTDYGRGGYERDYAGSSPYRGGTEYRSAGRYGVGWEPGGPGMFAGLGPKGYQRPDARIYEDVNDHLTDAPDVDASDIDVKVTNCEVTLSGTVRDRAQKRRAEEVAETVSGVREVHNNLRVSRWEEPAPAITTPTTASAPGRRTAGGRR